MTLLCLVIVAAPLPANPKSLPPLIATIGADVTKGHEAAAQMDRARNYPGIVRIRFVHKKLPLKWELAQETEAKEAQRAELRFKRALKIVSADKSAQGKATKKALLHAKENGMETEPIMLYIYGIKPDRYLPPADANILIDWAHAKRLGAVIDPKILGEDWLYPLLPK